MKRFEFWQKWLLSVGILLILFGLAMAFFNQSPVFDLLFNRQIDPLFWAGGVLPTQAQAFQRWIYGVLGATIAGWGVFAAFVAQHPFRKREKWAWNCTALGVGLWFLVDTGLSLNSGVGFNAAFNTILLILIFLPLWFTRADFFGNAT